MALAGRKRSVLADNIIVPYVDFRLMNELQHKELFYGLCENMVLAIRRQF